MRPTRQINVLGPAYCRIAFNTLSEIWIVLGGLIIVSVDRNLELVIRSNTVLCGSTATGHRGIELAKHT